MKRRGILALLAVALTPLAAHAAAPPAPPEPAVVYTVKPGDTFYDLAAFYLMRPSDGVYVQRLNRVRQARRLPVGRKLTVPADLLRSDPIIAKLSAYSGAVTVTGPGAAPLARNMPIREGFELSTGANAFLTFELPDGSRTTLPSQSHIRIERLRRILLTGAVHRDFRVQEGRSSSVVTPMTNPASRFRIMTPLSVSAVRGTEFRVAHDAAANRSAIEVIEGKVSGLAGAASDETLVTAGFGAATTSDGLTPPQALLPGPTLNNAARVQDDPEVSFELTPPAGAAGYRAQVARDAGFIDLIAEATAAEPKLAFPTVANGVFFARFTAIDGSGLEGLPMVYAFERRVNALSLDPPGAIPGVKRQYLFKWRSTGGAPETFRFMLGREPQAARAVVDETGLTERQVVVTDLPPGVYYWRVMVSRREDGRLFERWSPPQRFEIGG